MKHDELQKALRNSDPLTRARLLEKLPPDSKENIVQCVVESLADESLRVRGEAFAWLIAVDDDISNMISKNLHHIDRHIRGYCALVLANRGNSNKAFEISRLVKDESSMVRSCAVGALGYLKSIEYSGAILALLDDDSKEVRESAKHAVKIINL
ncbi:MAG: hypothetical protein K8823_347 [Cenarchaeum symbiont of Oopsacas minuta]|nr:hypothetical protein [Cenarchaeum symbiont of Oopsacas minuta]